MLFPSTLSLAALVATLTLSASAASPPIDGGAKSGVMGLVQQKTDTTKVPSGWQKADDKVFYLAPGTSSCGSNYTDSSMVACLDSFWMDKKQQNSCGRYVKVHDPQTKISVQVQALDTCGGGSKTFGHNDIYLSKKPFMILSGHKAKDNLNVGNLRANVTWEFVQESCEGCYGGILAYDGKHRQDSCKGADAMGNMRCGRKHDTDRVVTPSALAKLCTPDYQCPEEKKA